MDLMMPYEPRMAYFLVDPLLAQAEILNDAARDLSVMDTKNDQVKIDADQFCVKLDVHQFKPEELKVKLDKNKVIIHAKHEDKQDAHGYIKREFTRTYVLPENCNLEQLKSHFDKASGSLCIKCPRKAIQDKDGGKIIPIERC